MFALEGTGGAKTVLPDATPRNVTIKDWFVPSGLNFEDAAGVATTDAGDDLPTGIRVAIGGVYYVYSEFYFNGGGTACRYALRYGTGDDERQFCWVDSASTVASVATPEPPKYRKCSLGFVARLEKGAELKLVYLHQNSCRTDLNSLRKAQKRAKMGIIRVD